MAEVRRRGSVRWRSIRRPEHADGDDPFAEDQAWMRHATGILTTAEHAAADGASAGKASPQERAAVLAGEAWPPEGAEVVDIEDFYDALVELGLEYGVVFRGLQSVWRRGEEVFAEVSLGTDGSNDALSTADMADGAASFGLHPALLDAVLQASVASFVQDGQQGDAPVKLRLPFSFSGVQLYAGGAGSLRAAFTVGESDARSLLVLDDAGVLVASVDSWVGREVSAGQLGAAGAGRRDSLFAVGWQELPLVAEQGPVAERGSAAELGLAVIGGEDSPLARSLGGGVAGLESFVDLAALGEALDGGRVSVPGVVLFDCRPGAGVAGGDRGAGLVGGEPVSAGVERALGVVQAWLADERPAGLRLALVTGGAVQSGVGDRLVGLGCSPVWGLVRSAQLEDPELFVLVDVDGSEDSWGVFARALATGEPQLALRKGVVLVPRLKRARALGGVLEVPSGVSEWQLSAGGTGTLEDLALVEAPAMAEPLKRGQVRVGVRAGGLNFREVLIALGMYPGCGCQGSEGSGVVLELGAGVEDLVVGDRVMGMLPGFGPVAVADRRSIARMPEGWSFAQAAAIPVAFMTAYYALVDLAGLKRGERLLVHAGTGGVGMAAVQLARHIGAEVFVTASPGKWGVLREWGFDEAHIASSRSLEFRERFLAETDGQGMDVVLDSLAGEFVDASLDLLGRGDAPGRFIEMGKTDIRDADVVAGERPGVRYRAFDLLEAGLERVEEMLGGLLELFADGTLEPLPVTACDIRRAPEAFRFMSQARHTGKIVLSLPVPLDAGGTVLVTGGTGVLGGLVARHLVVEHGVRRLLLVSRSGEGAEGAAGVARGVGGVGCGGEGRGV